MPRLAEYIQLKYSFKSLCRLQDQSRNLDLLSYYNYINAMVTSKNMIHFLLLKVLHEFHQSPIYVISKVSTAD